jgi:hypothetical protein
MGTPDALEDRLRAVEDTLAIYHLIASHPPAADTGTDRYYRDAFAKRPSIRMRLPVVSVILPDCRALCSVAIPRWRRHICRSSPPTGMVRRASCLATAHRPVFASTALAPIVGSSSAKRTGGK